MPVLSVDRLPRLEAHLPAANQPFDKGLEGSGCSRLPQRCWESAPRHDRIQGKPVRKVTFWGSMWREPWHFGFHEATAPTLNKGRT